MKQLDDKQKKIVLIVVAVLVFVHFAPSYIGMLLYSFGHRNQPQVVQNQRPVPPPPPKPVVPAAPAIDPIAAQYLGTFQGAQTLADGQLTNCQVKLEVKPAISKTGFFSAYETRSCRPSPFAYHGKLTTDRWQQAQKAMLDASPIQTSMSGSIVEGNMNFRIDQVIGASGDHCGPSTYKLSPFGTGQVMAVWEDCGPGGHIVLVRART